MLVGGGGGWAGYLWSREGRTDGIVLLIFVM